MTLHLYDSWKERWGTTQFAKVRFDISQLLQLKDGLEWLESPLNTNETNQLHYERCHG
jgi:hypothetical protein